MSPEQVLTILKSAFPEAVESIALDDLHPHAVVKTEHWRQVALFLRDDPRLRFDWLRCITGVDHLEDKKLTAIYGLHATRQPQTAGGMWSLGAEIAIKVRVDRDSPHIPSVADIWPAADWHEREAFDLLGIAFDGHPNLKRILCCDDWVGHPLRKDYEFPLEYHGIPAVTEYEMTRLQH
ncbi:MAG: NADH-quinone oxidoreductase subunit C [Phycisphaerae bacterium]